jgi:hypothetical protein
MPSIRAVSTLSLALALALGAARCSPPPPVGPAAAGGGGMAVARAVADVPVPSGADRVYADSLVLGGLDQWIGRLVLKTGLAPDEAFAYYRAEMPGLGWQPLASIQSEVSVLSFERAERVATVLIEGRTFGGSLVSITMAPRQDGARRDRPAADRSVQVEPLNN